MTDNTERTERPIERGFPIERVNEIAAKESRAKQWYRPIYTMHKWWARRPGCLFRAITLYSLLDEDTDPDELAVYEPGENQTLGTNGHSATELLDAAADVDMDNPESLWEFYPKDVRLPEDTKVLDPFAGGGTSLVEASRFGVESEGYDLNPVAWFVTKKELEAGETDVEELERAFERVREDVADEITQYYKTPCPNGDHDADVMYNFWVKELDCTSCDHTVPLFKDYRVAAGRYENDDSYNVLCPDCGAVTLVDDWEAEESTCGACFATFDASAGHVSRGGYYNCPECGQKEGITDAIAEQGKPDERLYAVEYYCEECEDMGEPKSVHKGYKRAELEDEQLYQNAAERWKSQTHLHNFVPDENIPEGAKTCSSGIDGSDVFQHGYEQWTDMFNQRQLLSLSILLKSISKIKTDAKEFLLMAFGDSLMFQSTFTIYNKQRNNMEGIFRVNGLVPQTDFVENNVWGAEHGRGNFVNTWEKLVRGVEFAHSPTDRFSSKNKEMVKTDEFGYSIGNSSRINLEDMRKINKTNEYDAVITDPPYYDNVIYSELSDYFYVWQKILLNDEYSGFEDDTTPRADSIVTNPYLNKTEDDFEHEMSGALSVIRNALKNNGVLTFTYHHSDAESWGELLTSLCKNSFEITATYPISSDLNKFHGGDAVSFDIVIVARPTDDREPTSWRTLRREIVRTARETRETLEENRDLASGDIGVIEMGKCFQEYSKHHGKVHRAGEIMDAKEVVEQIYGIIQDADLGETDVYLDLLEQRNVTTDDLNKLLRRADATQDRMVEMELLATDATGLELRDWRDETRQAYARDAVEDPDTTATTLDRAHLLRNVYEQGGSRREYLDDWDHDELQELCEDLARVTGDEVYLRMLGADVTLEELGAD